MTTEPQRADAQPGLQPTILSVSLREYLEARFNGERERLDGRFSDHLVAHQDAKEAHASQHTSEGTAIALADAVQKLHDQGANEWRASLTDANARFLTRPEAEAIVSATVTARAGLSDRLDKIERSREREAGALSTWRFIALFLGLPGIAALVLSLATALGPR